MSVNLYFTTKAKQYTVINTAIKNRCAETSLAGSAIVIKASIETVSE